MNQDVSKHGRVGRGFSGLCWRFGGRLSFRIMGVPRPAGETPVIREFASPKASLTQFRAKIWMLLAAVSLVAGLAPARAAEVIPPKPVDRFTDTGGVVSGTAASEFNDTLRAYEQSSSNVILVAVYPTMQSDSDMADYCTRVAHTWKAGQAGKSNGVVLFIFTRDRKMHIATGYGMEGNLPDAICERIIAEQIAPSFKQQDYESGIRAGIAGMIAAAGGNYESTASRHAPPVASSPPGIGTRIWQWGFCTFFVLGILFVIRMFVGAIIAGLASILLAIFYRDQSKRTSKLARFLMWLEIHAQVQTKQSSWVGGPSGSNRRRSSGSTYSSYSSSSSSSFSSSDSSSSSDSFSSGGDYGGGGASGSW